MKTNIFFASFTMIIVVISICNFNVFAKENLSDKTIQWGVTAGIDYSNFVGNDANLKSNIQYTPQKGDILPIAKSGFIGGLFIEIPLSRRFSFQPEILYSQTGAKYSFYLQSFPVYSIPYTLDYSLGYINIPLLLKYKVPVFDLFEFNVFAGPQVGVNISAKVDMKTTDSPIVYIPINQWTIDTIQKPNNVQRFTASGVVGAGFSRNIGYGTLGIEFRYVAPFMNLAKSSTDPNDYWFTFYSKNEPKVKNSVFSLMLTYSFK